MEVFSFAAEDANSVRIHSHARFQRRIRAGTSGLAARQRSPRILKNGTFNRPGGDTLLRTIHDTETRNFGVRKLFLSFSSPTFQDMFRLLQPPTSSATSNCVDGVDVTHPPRALELILGFVHLSIDVPIIENLTISTEAMALADKHNINPARMQLRLSFREFATEPLKA